MLARRAGGFKTSIALPSIGDAWLGGYYTGIIDTTKGNIEVDDASAVGARYALICAPYSKQTGSLSWGPAGTSPAASLTRWDGLFATAALNSSSYPAAYYCAGLSKPSGDDASSWYLPALDELELLFRNFNPTAHDKTTGLVGGTGYPSSSWSNGKNDSSDPPGAAYTTSTPAKTSVSVFQGGGAQAFGDGSAYIYLWSSTANSNSYAWHQKMCTPGSGLVGEQSTGVTKTTGSGAMRVRPVRRLVLT